MFKNIFGILSFCAILQACGPNVGNVKLSGGKTGSGISALSLLGNLEEDFIGSDDYAPAANSGINASYLKLKIYKFAVSTDPYCSNMITVYSNPEPEYFNMYTSPKFGTADVPEGTYPCVAWEMSDVIKFSPAASSDNGNCVAGTEYSRDVCHNGNSGLRLDGTTTNCTSGGDDIVPVYITTASTNASGGDAFNPPSASTVATNGVKLNGAMTISGQVQAVFQISGDSAVDGTSSPCDHGVPTFGFVSQAL